MRHAPHFVPSFELTSTTRGNHVEHHDHDGRRQRALAVGVCIGL
jgi:hypothetical protein